MHCTSPATTTEMEKWRTLGIIDIFDIKHPVYFFKRHLLAQTKESTQTQLFHMLRCQVSKPHKLWFISSCRSFKRSPYAAADGWILLSAEICKDECAQPVLGQLADAIRLVGRCRAAAKPLAYWSSWDQNGGMRLLSTDPLYCLHSTVSHAQQLSTAKNQMCSFNSY